MLSTPHDVGVCGITRGTLAHRIPVNTRYECTCVYTVGIPVDSTPMRVMHDLSFRDRSDAVPSPASRSAPLADVHAWADSQGFRPTGTDEFASRDDPGAPARRPERLETWSRARIRRRARVVANARFCAGPAGGTSCRVAVPC